VPKNGAGVACRRASVRSGVAAVRARSAAVRRSRQICTTVNPGAHERPSVSSVASRMTTICAAMRACGASAGISPPISWTSRARRACRQAVVAVAGGGANAASAPASRSVLRWYGGTISRMTSAVMPLDGMDMKGASG
jgi:hypothetical protein